MVVGYESVTTSWAPSKIHMELGIVGDSSQASFGGPSPMEIDLVSKGKGKGKKGKGKDTNSKGKGKQQSKGGKTGKGKDSSSKGKGTGQTQSSDVCLFCGKKGHWKRDCWALNGKPSGKKSVNAVTSDDSISQTDATSTASTSPPASSVGAPSTKAVRVISALSEPLIEEVFEDEDDSFELYDLTSHDADFHGSCNVVSHVDPFHPGASDFTQDSETDLANLAYMHFDSFDSRDFASRDFALHRDSFDSRAFALTVEHFDMTYSDDDLVWTLFHDDCLSMHHVRAIGERGPPGTAVEIVLDSGADGSVLPLEYATVGEPDRETGDFCYVDAQGKPIAVKTVRVAELHFGNVAFKERFIVAKVTTPLISMGRLLRSGWSVANGKRNSLCAYGNIRMMTSEDETSNTHHVRALTLGPALSNLASGWNQPRSCNVAANDTCETC